MNLKEKLKRNLKSHLVDTTAILAESHPVFSVYEVGIAKLSADVFLNMKLFSTAALYGGLGYVYAGGRDFSRKIFRIKDRTSEKIQQIHDMAYGAVFNSIVAPSMYYISGERDIAKLTVATFGAVVIGTLNGGVIGACVDIFRDLTGMKRCDRKIYPNFIKRRNSKIKKAVAAAIVGASISSLGVIYSLAPEKKLPDRASSDSEISYLERDKLYNLEELMQEESLLPH